MTPPHPEELLDRIIRQQEITDRQRRKNTYRRNLRIVDPVTVQRSWRRELAEIVGVFLFAVAVCLLFAWLGGRA